MKRALYLDPFEWIIAYNLGLVHLNTAQYASAFHYFSAALHLKPEFASTYMYIGIVLNKMGDNRNSCASFKRALEMKKEPTTYFNYAITLYNQGNEEEAKKMFNEGERMFQESDTKSRDSEPEMLEQRKELVKALNINIT